MPQGFNFPGMGSSGAQSDSQLAMALNYVGDDLETYQGIWNNAKLDSDEEDYARVVEAIKHVCQGDSIADYLNVDNVLKYLAIQTFIYNHDGLTGNVSHNYYLYEEDGKLNLIPWDLNEAFTVSGNGSDYVNFPIDTPFTVTDLSQRSFFMALLENPEYLAQYHEYLRQLSEDYALGGGLETTLARIRGMIDSLVETDPTAFSTYEQYESAAASLQTAIQLRAQSVLGQNEAPSLPPGKGRPLNRTNCWIPPMPICQGLPTEVWDRAASACCGCRKITNKHLIAKSIENNQPEDKSCSSRLLLCLQKKEHRADGRWPSVRYCLQRMNL